MSNNREYLKCSLPVQVLDQVMKIKDSSGKHMPVRFPWKKTVRLLSVSFGKDPQLIVVIRRRKPRENVYGIRQVHVYGQVLLEDCSYEHKQLENEPYVIGKSRIDP